MSMSHDNLFDRLLRYAPYAAAVLVGLCFVALIARVAMDARAGGDRGHALASAAETGTAEETRLATSQQVARQAEDRSPGFKNRPESATALEGRRTGIAASASTVQRSLKEPQTPSSKSRLEIHGVRGGSVARKARRTHAGRSAGETVSDSRPLRSSSSGTGAAPTAAALDAIAQIGGRAPALDGRAHTSFFGLEASGRRFVYVLDRSGSMGQPNNKPLSAAKDELLASLSRLDTVHQFFLIFYNEEPAIFKPTGGGRQLVFADELNKRSARRFVESIRAHGGTKHYEALSKAIALRPDVIFLLTDGEPKDDLAAEDLARLKRLNGGLAQIHVVQFAGAPYAGNSLVQLANENRGQHTYKDLREVMLPSADKLD